MKKILFFGNDAGRTGAPMVLYWLMQYIKQNNPDLKMQLVLLNSGSMLPNFESVSEKTHVWNYPEPQDPSIVARGIKKISNKLTVKAKQKRILSEIKKFKPDLIYANTGAIGSLFGVIKNHFAHTKKIIHIHELEFILEHHCGADFKTHIDIFDQYITVSAPVAQNLIKTYGIDEKKIFGTRAFIPADFDKQVNLKKVAEIKQELSIEQDDFVVGLVGVGGWRKGVDLLIPLLERFSKIYHSTTKVHFIWLGLDQGSSLFNELIFDLKKLNTPFKLHLIPKVSDPYNYYPIFDLQLLLAREDPFPLVILEGGMLQTPFICFKNSGGMPYLADELYFETAEYLNLEDMATKMTHLIENPAKLKQMKVAIEKKVKNDLTDEAILPDLIKQIIG